MVSLLALLFVSGCSSNTSSILEEPTVQTEPLENLTMESADVMVLGTDYMIMTTENRTIKEPKLNISIYQTSADKDTVTYDLYSNGDLDNIDLHLTEEGVKKYSQQYTDAFGVTMKVKPDKEWQIRMNDWTPLEHQIKAVQYAAWYLRENIKEIETLLPDVDDVPTKHQLRRLVDQYRSDLAVYEKALEQV